jgi:hypothetical protein
VVCLCHASSEEAANELGRAGGEAIKMKTLILCNRPMMYLPVLFITGRSNAKTLRCMKSSLDALRVALVGRTVSMAVWLGLGGRGGRKAMKRRGRLHGY